MDVNISPRARSRTRTSSPPRQTDAQAVLDGIRRIVQRLHEASRAAHQRTGLTGAQIFVLRGLADGGPMSVNDLARRTFTHQSSVSTVITRLRARGLVRQTADGRDRRKRILALTSTGRAALAKAPYAFQARLIETVQELTPATRKTVARALERIADAMSASRRPGMFFEAGGRRG